MTGARSITPRAGTRACFHCSAWSPWDHISIGEDRPTGFVILGRKPTGQCRANPPTINPDAIGSESAAWPVVEADAWCRQFETRDTAHDDRSSA